jgi:hypothetical protein
LDPFSGLKPIFKKSLAYGPAPFGYGPGQVPCGQCIGCRLERSRDWACRCVNEASLYSENCMITLTYAPEYLPSNGTLVKDHIQLFKKRLRKKYSGTDLCTNSRGEQGYFIRTFECGEYGEQFERPHYHGLLFNFDFPDKKLYKSSNGFRLYNSPSLAELWPFGHSVINDVTFASAAYVARYITKKVNGPSAESHYDGRLPEFLTMSQGIGRGWIEKYLMDTYKDDTVLVNNHPSRPPRYYDKFLQLTDEELYDRIKIERIRNANDIPAIERTQARLFAKEQVAIAKFRSCIRSYESDFNSV